MSRQHDTNAADTASQETLEGRFGCVFCFCFLRGQERQEEKVAVSKQDKSYTRQSIPLHEVVRFFSTTCTPSSGTAISMYVLLALSDGMPVVVVVVSLIMVCVLAEGESSDTESLVADCEGLRGVIHSQIFCDDLPKKGFVSDDDNRFFIHSKQSSSLTPRP